AALGSAARPSLRSLSIKRRHFDDNYPDIENRAVDTQRLWAKLPALRELALDGVDIVSTLSHARLETLVLDDRPIEPGARWKLPKLRWIDWKCYWQSSGDAVDTSPEVFDALWQQELPALRELTLRASLIEPILPYDRPEVAHFIARLSRLRVSISMFD